MKATIIGGGSWGTALAQLCALKGHETWLWLRNHQLSTQVLLRHENTRYLPGVKLHDKLKPTSNLEAALEDADILIYASPSQSLRDFLPELLRLAPADCAFIMASKGIDLLHLQTMSQLSFELEPALRQRYAVLSGPSFAREVMRELPTAVVLGSENRELGTRLREELSFNFFRVYSNTDLRGVELGGSVKNVIAIAAGISDGLQFGHNARAALITRGLAEISRLGVAMGANAGTFMGLSGLGDLVLTCTGDLSRNRQVGLRLAAGQSLEQITREMTSLAEGIKTTESVHALARRLGVEMPITESMYGVIHDHVPPLEAVKMLMSRDLKSEE